MRVGVGRRRRQSNPWPITEWMRIFRLGPRAYQHMLVPADVPTDMRSLVLSETPRDIRHRPVNRACGSSFLGGSKNGRFETRFFLTFGSLSVVLGCSSPAADCASIVIHASRASRTNLRRGRPKTADPTTATSSSSITAQNGARPSGRRRTLPLPPTPTISTPYARGLSLG